MRSHLLLSTVALLVMGVLRAQETSLRSATSRLGTHFDGGFWLSLEAASGGKSYAIRNPLVLDVDGVRSSGRYQQAHLTGGGLTCQGILRGPNGTRFHFFDQYLASADGSFELSRDVQITDPHQGDISFNTAVSIELGDATRLEELEFFVPGVWYRNNFAPRIAGALASDPSDHNFLFREDRLPLPLVTARDIRSGGTLTLIHAESDPKTFIGDGNQARVVDERLQYGSIGVRRNNHISLDFLFPGSEGEKNRVVGENPQGWAVRSHPVQPGVAHRYKLVLAATTEASYPSVVARCWKRAFDLYQPKLRSVDLKVAFQGLLDTLDHYAVGKSDGYDAPGFPFSVILPEGKARIYNYQMGFIGRQLPNAYFLIHEGLDNGRRDWLEKGESIVDFWAGECLLPDGLPRTWYDPSRDKNKRGLWRAADNRHGGIALRVAATGMEGMLAAWQKMHASGRDKPGWLAACRKFGDWLVANQNPDGSYYLAYNPEWTDGRHAPIQLSKATTTNSIRFLTQLHHATKEERFRQAAVRAGEFSLQYIHEPYYYAGSVIDNPVTIDRESGQEALAAFLTLYDETKEARWLDAAVQAGRFTETWMYAYEVSAVPGGPNAFPADRSIVGQTLIATGHSSADLGLAFSSFDYYRLYLFTGDVHFLEVARLLVHNTKQALNWNGTIYPGLPKGLQLEAFTVTIPRRQGVLECLSWNFAAHLDPLIRFKDRFGNIDLDVIEKLPLETRRARNE